MNDLPSISRRAPRLRSLAFGGALFAVISLALAGCNGAQNDTPAATTESDASYEVMEDVHVYTVRGVVRRMPDPDMPGRPELQILHEAIPNWVNAEGYETGMQGMTMPFLVADGVSLEGIEPGSQVRFTFEVDWEESTMQLTDIQPFEEPAPETPTSPLPGDTEMPADSAMEEGGAPGAGA